MLSACANVQHFEREFLADPIMQFSENPLSEAYEERMHRALAQGLTGVPAGGGRMRLRAVIVKRSIPSPCKGEGYDCMDAGGRATQEQLPRMGVA